MIIFITGASAGFGQAMAKRFVKEGHTVIATARRLERLTQLKEELGDNLIPLSLDVRHEEEVKKAIDSLPADLQKIDVLVNNAGLAVGTTPIQDSQIEDWKTMIETNINGLLYTTHYVLKKMMANQKGHIINLGSVAGEFPYPGGNVYGATKAFVHQLSLNMRADLVANNIRVTNIEPGMCETEFSIVRFNGDEKKASDVYKNMTPLSADDIAETVLWVITRPPHVNINVISLMPTQQAFSAFNVARTNT